MLVDDDDHPYGMAEKIEAHKSGLLHRAISVFLFDKDGRLLLQRRSASKYHAAGLWANSCCGHPRPGELPIDAAVRRLQEELGIHSELSSWGHICYEATINEEMKENEYVHLFTGCFTGAYSLNPDEVSEIQLEYPRSILSGDSPLRSSLTPWFKIYLDKLWKV
uniref:Isopentenyl-diphosphate delta-isomerase n=1 Tax=Pseudomonas syringae pv. cerasicola TaxID=264451 RepID=A0A330JVL8_PSESX|nr:isopentenyl-diphosphate Delta-isomerase [Pseudomonas syringae]SPD89354.1 putative isopentenyl-diphosphate delta-isomerase, type 1 [Pseudomonas syringae pv. cerasicola]